MAHRHRLLDETPPRILGLCPTDHFVPNHGIKPWRPPRLLRLFDPSSLVQKCPIFSMVARPGKEALRCRLHHLHSHPDMGPSSRGCIVHKSAPFQHSRRWWIRYAAQRGPTPGESWAVARFEACARRGHCARWAAMSGRRCGPGAGRELVISRRCRRQAPSNGDPTANSSTFVVASSPATCLRAAYRSSRSEHSAGWRIGLRSATVPKPNHPSIRAAWTRRSYLGA